MVHGPWSSIDLALLKALLHCNELLPYLLVKPFLGIKYIVPTVISEVKLWPMCGMDGYEKSCRKW